MPTQIIGGSALGMSYDGSRDVGYTNNRAERQAANAERKTYRRMQKGLRKGLLSGMGKAEQSCGCCGSSGTLGHERSLGGGYAC